MKSICLMLFVALMSLTTVAFAQHDAHKATDQVAPPEAQKSFDTMKSLAGNWEGPVTVDPPQPEMSDGKPLHISMRVTSRGNALVHEMQEAGTPNDPARYDHPVTMFYVDSGRLTLVHYCDAGNRPRMLARPSADGKSVEFDFSDISGSTDYGHMHHAVFTLIDSNHHIEDWTYMMPGDKPIHAHFDLKRTQ
ncbi:MAG TPA: hypothetical protein VKH63_08985 [Candidatus Acidoferrum sp.]|nr:hypothetical protein [Candidatus Acidoferrum sp.]